jgi:hypothetical protein
MHVEIAAGSDIPLQLPPVTDTLMTGIEVLGVSPVDTTDIGNSRIRLNYDYLITSFDSALYLLPPFEVIQGSDTAYSEPLALKVSTMPVDTESKKFYDIKALAQPKFVIWDYILIPVIVLVIVLVLGLAGIVIYRLVKKKTVFSFRKEEPNVPPHIRALAKLEEIRLQKLWQQGKQKLYHSEVTGTLRDYLDGRFGVCAMEMTSGEILDAVKNIEEINPVNNQLKQILSLADFVKFAKYTPLPDENEMSFTNACLFVEQTKKEETVIEEKKQ